MNFSALTRAYPLLIISPCPEYRTHRSPDPFLFLSCISCTAYFRPPLSRSLCDYGILFPHIFSPVGPTARNPKRSSLPDGYVHEISKNPSLFEWVRFCLLSPPRIFETTFLRGALFSKNFTSILSKSPSSGLPFTFRLRSATIGPSPEMATFRTDSLNILFPLNYSFPYSGGFPVPLRPRCIGSGFVERSVGGQDPQPPPSLQ